MKMKYLLISLVFFHTAFAKESFIDSVSRTKWDIGKEEIDVVWIKDDKFPKFTASVYFQDGALNDTVPGQTQIAFDQLTAGTSKENQRELAEFFDFYGANLRHSVTHEYSVFTVQALTKDIKPVMTKVCELFSDAQYPDSELQSYLSRAKSGLKNLVTSHSALADRVFRKVSLKESAYAHPVEGSLESYEKITREILKSRLESLNKTRKVLYIAGPSEVKELEEVIGSKCKWTNQEKLTRQEVKKPQPESAIYLVEVPGANQAQIRVGRYMSAREFDGKFDQFHFMSSFLGGGFTSKLVQELRVKRGLTYSAGAYASMQRDYGRTGLITFSKNETAAEAISIIRDVLGDVATGKFEEKEFIHQKNHQIGAYAFGFEETTAFLGQIMLYDHQGRDLQQLVSFPKTIGNLTMSDLARSTMESFPWERLTIVVVGDKSLVKSLSRIRPVRLVNFEDYL
jgi:zinc protease